MFTNYRKDVYLGKFLCSYAKQLV